MRDVLIDWDSGFLVDHTAAGAWGFMEGRVGES